MIIGLCGYTGVGKDEVAKHLVAEYGFTRVAFADAMRDDLYKLNPWIENVQLQTVVDFCGWDASKRQFPEIRRLLQVYGTEVVRANYGDDVWINRAMPKIQSAEKCVITDVRFENEVEAIRGLYGCICHVKRPGHEAINGHASEQLDYDAVADSSIMNSGSLFDLYDAVDEVVRYA